MYRTLLVPLDGSAFGEHALPLALAVAQRSGAALHLLRVHPTSRYRAESATDYDPDDARDVESDYLLDVAARIEAAARLDAVLHHLDGPVADTIRTVAQAADIDLVVMATHARTGLSRALAGSVADAVIRRSGRPVLLVRPAAGAPDLRAEPALPEHVLVPLDGSPEAEAVFPHALRLGALTGARYTLARVVVSLPSSARLYAYSNGEMTSGWESATHPVAEAEIDLVGAERRFAAQAGGLEVKTAAGMAADPAAALLAYAHQHAVDLIAMATHGRGASRLLVGSVADNLLRATDLPLLLFRPPGA